MAEVDLGGIPMRFSLLTVLIAACCVAFSTPALADDEKLRTALGAAAGAAAGAIVGDEAAGRDGAIVGAALGGAAGAALASSPEANHGKGQKSATVSVTLQDQTSTHPRTRHCPPGQAKNGRC